MLMKSYFHRIDNIGDKSILTSSEKFNTAKKRVFDKVFKSNDNIKNEPLVNDILNDAFVDTILNHNDKKNFGTYFSIILNRYRKKNKRCLKIEKEFSTYEDKYFEKENNEIIKLLVHRIIREFNPRRKFYFCLKNSIYFEKPRDNLEKEINDIVLKKQNITYREIGELFGQIFYKKIPPRQSVERMYKQSEKIFIEEIKKIKTIEDFL